MGNTAINILSGITKGGLRGLQYIKQQNALEEEKAEEKRKKLEEDLRRTLPWAKSKEQAQTMMQLAGIPQDQQKIFEPIIGVNYKKPGKDIPAAVTQIERLLTQEEPGWNTKRAYGLAKEIIMRDPNMTDFQRGHWLDYAAGRLGYSIKKTGSALSTSEKIALNKLWNDLTPTGKRALEQEHPAITFKREVTKPEKGATGRTPEEMLKDQLYEVRDLITDVDSNIKSLQSAIPESEAANKADLKKQLTREMKKRKFLVSRRSDIRNRKTPLSETQFKEFISPLSSKLRSKQTELRHGKRPVSKIKAKPGSKRQKAIDYLKKHGEQVVEENIQYIMKQL